MVQRLNLIKKIRHWRVKLKTWRYVFNFFISPDLGPSVILILVVLSIKFDLKKDFLVEQEYIMAWDLSKIKSDPVLCVMFYLSLFLFLSFAFYYFDHSILFGVLNLVMRCWIVKHDDKIYLEIFSNPSEVLTHFRLFYCISYRNKESHWL